VLRLLRASFLAATLGRFETALRLDRQTLAADPLNPIGWRDIARHASSAGRPDEALVAARKALELNPQMPSAHC